MKQFLYISILFGVIIGLTACVKETPIEVLIQEEVDEKIENFKEKKRKRCRRFILSQAEKEVDSTMYMKIGSTLSGSVVVPEKPARPLDSFAYQAELDTNPVKQIYTDSILLDTNQIMQIDTGSTLSDSLLK